MTLGKSCSLLDPSLSHLQNGGHHFHLLDCYEDKKAGQTFDVLFPGHYPRATSSCQRSAGFVSSGQGRGCGGSHPGGKKSALGVSASLKLDPIPAAAKASFLKKPTFLSPISGGGGRRTETLTRQEGQQDTLSLRGFTGLGIKILACR